MNPELEYFIKNADTLPTIPVIATKIIELTECENISVDEISRVVASDASISASVLKMSNSTFYGCARQINTLPHAVMVLGLNTLKSLVIAASAKQVYQPFGLTEKMLWEHSFGAGLAARIIAKETDSVSGEEAFICGLFHDIGKNIMNFLDNRKFHSVMEICYNDGVSFTDAEQKVYPYSHAEVGALVMHKWNFPDSIINTVANHHDFIFKSDEDQYSIKLTCVAGLSDMFCRKTGIGIRQPDPELNIIDSVPAVTLEIDQEKLDIMLEVFTETFERDRSYFD
ncbi:MAG: HDOD domain-containing protein [Desulfuromonadales bacterium]